MDDYYTGYQTLREKAEDAVAAINEKDERKPYLERINQKINALNQEAEEWKDVSDSKASYEKQKEQDAQAKALKEQEEKNKQNRITSQVKKCQSYIDMVNDLDTYSNTAEVLLKKAKSALSKIEDASEQSRMTDLYNDAVDHVSELKKEALQNDEDSSEEEGGDSLW